MSRCRAWSSLVVSRLLPSTRGLQRRLYSAESVRSDQLTSFAIATYVHRSQVKVGIIEDPGSAQFNTQAVVHPLWHNWREVSSMDDVIHNWPLFHAMLMCMPRFERAATGGSFQPGCKLGEGIPLSEVTLRAPCLPSRNLMGIAKNYLPRGEDRVKPPHPVIFTKTPQCVVGHLADVEMPPEDATVQLDYEAELAVVLGKGGKRIREEDAWEHIFGFTITNDLTARDTQKRHSQFFLGKSMDGFSPLGPWIVPKEAVPGGATMLAKQGFEIICHVNDEERQRGWTSEMLFGIPELIAVLSRGMTLLPGDVICTGTPDGAGATLSPPRFLRAGDTMKIQIPGIGTLTNRLV